MILSRYFRSIALWSDTLDPLEDWTVLGSDGEDDESLRFVAVGVGAGSDGVGTRPDREGAAEE